VLGYKGSSGLWPNYSEYFEILKGPEIEGVPDKQRVYEIIQRGYDTTKILMQRKSFMMDRYSKLFLILIQLSYIYIRTKYPGKNLHYLHAIFNLFNKIKIRAAPPLDKPILGILKKYPKLDKRIERDEFISLVKYQSGGGIESLIESLYEKITDLTIVYTASVRNLLKSLKNKGYISEKVRATSIASPADEEDLETTIDTLIEDLRDGPLSSTIDSLPPLDEDSEFYSESVKDLPPKKSLEKILTTVKKDTSALKDVNDHITRMKKIFEKQKTAHRPRAPPAITDLLAHFA
jgi:hypothetical protein